eukprot:CAMPEP_0113848994 /NCGR_PEP_ID=MMETSP0372-20130328/2829_1 /TAXON_ID=340204 /ORGANISM="Lankesteria abbotti" /LENGTH=82 /DNA_ID=CAMNT_0000818625 /DNA_START=51 /DNA_END=299 /DNA_ORIENTATION=+ /assembly_acc=CAM_ASM_000359
MEDENKNIVDLYIPRKCSATNRLISAKEHGSIQINIGETDENGHYTGKCTTFALSANIRKRGESDACLLRLCNEKGMIAYAK